MSGNSVLMPMSSSDGKRGNEEEGVHNTARCSGQAEATADSSRMIISYTMEGGQRSEKCGM